jgi:prevent-host-death family protein
MLEFLQKNTVTVAELQAQADKIITKTKRSGQPFLITQNGKPTALLIDVKAFFEELAAENLSRLIAVGEADIAAGRVYDFNEALEEIRRERKVQHSSHPPV